jgi:adenylosuccinate synthase
MPWHIDLDYKREENLSLKIGTTKKGIGPCYSDKYARRGTRICDLLSYNKLVLDNAKAACEENIYLKDLYNEHNITEILSSKTNLLNNLISIGYITISNDIFKESDRVLFEGAQSILLDIDHGTYPYVSSSHAGISGILNTYPISPKDIDIVYGIFKPYTTKVGTGPYPSEMDEETSKIIREIGKEYGTTTGRPRRCGWFDSVAAKYAIKTAQITQVALMKLDVLSSFEKIKICTHYELDGNTINYFPKDINILNRCKPIYTEIPGWKENISDVNNWHYLPSEAKSFINFIAQNIGSPIRQVSVGAERNQIIKL